MGNKNMSKAKINKNDEFYTQMSDIEKEVKHYREQFKGKVVYCNCDDPAYFEGHEDVNNKGSNFWNYFQLNFDFLGLKKLIATHYDEENPTYKLEYDGKEVVKTDLLENGDFRSNESIELLKEADIVCTNPPFSLFREYVAQLMEYEKDFLIIGNFNSVTYKEIFPLIKNNRMWLGYSPRSMDFKTPSGELKTVNAAWFTNLDVEKRHEDIILYKDYSSEEYLEYDNYDAIEISRVNNIPRDYGGVMGVPITFLTKYNPEQFEILGMSKTPICFENEKSAQRKKVYQNLRQINSEGEDVGGGNKLNDGASIKLDVAPKKGTYYRDEKTNDIYISTYARILIKSRKL